MTLSDSRSYLMGIDLKSRGASRGGRGAGGLRGRGSAPSGPQTSPEERKKREAILDLSKYVNERIRVKFTGGREGSGNFVLTDMSSKKHDSFFLAVTGILKGYDQLLNLVLDEVQEEVQGAGILHCLHVGWLTRVILEPEVHIRSLGLTVLRGPTITLLSPVDGLEEIANPFMAQE